jgi:hypothetical protein
VAVGTIPPHRAELYRILQLCRQDFCYDCMPDNGILYGEQDFNPPVKASRHQVSPAKE